MSMIRSLQLVLYKHLRSSFIHSNYICGKIPNIFFNTSQAERT